MPAAVFSFAFQHGHVTSATDFNQVCLREGRLDLTGPVDRDEGICITVD